MVLDPIYDKTVWRQQSKDRPVVNGLQGTNPGIELLLGQLRLQDADALVPKRRFSGHDSPGCL